MLIRDENLSYDSLSSESIWKSTHNAHTLIKKYGTTKPTYYSKKNSKRLNFNYNESNIQKLNEKAKNSQKKTFRNNR